MAPEQDVKSPSTDAAVSSLAKRLQGLLHETRHANRVSLIGGVVLAIFIAAYMHFLIVGRLEVYIKDPATIATLIRVSAEQHVPQVMRELERSLKTNAPEMIAQARTQLMTALPETRKAIEKQAVETIVKEVRAVIQGNLDKVVDDMVRNQKGKLEPLIAKASSEDGVHKLTEEFTHLFEEGLGKPFRDRLEEGKYVQRLRHMAEYMRRLRTAKDLTPKEQVEREWVEHGVSTIAHLLHITVKGDKAKP